MSYPNFKNKYTKKSIFLPSKHLPYQKKQGKYTKVKPPEGIILCYQKSLIEFILKNYKTTKIKLSSGRTFYLLDDTKGKVGVDNFGISASNTAIILEELIAIGVKKFISIGTAGTLQKDINIGDFVICEKAIRDEGISYHYLKDSKYAYASKEMINKLINTLNKFKQKYFVGTSWTIDALYRETLAEVIQYQKEGVATVEMEASALFAVAQYRNVELGAIFVISDSIAKLVWEPKFFSKKVTKGLEILYKVAVDVLVSHQI